MLAAAALLTPLSALPLFEPLPGGCRSVAERASRRRMLVATSLLFLLLVSLLSLLPALDRLFRDVSGLFGSEPVLLIIETHE